MADPALPMDVRTAQVIENRWKKKAVPGPTVQEARRDIFTLLEMWKRDRATLARSAVFVAFLGAMTALATAALFVTLLAVLVQ